MHNMMVLRSRMVPYLYTAARNMYESGVGFLHPLYYDWPEYLQPYMANFTHQYMFGPYMMVAPVVTQTAIISGLSTQSLWFPPGRWIEFDSGRLFDGGQQGLVVQRTYALDELGVYVSDGAIVSLLPENKPLLGSAQQPYTSLVLRMFIGQQRQGSHTIYEDDGYTLGYMNDQFTLTDVKYLMSADGTTMDIIIDEPRGGFTDAPMERNYTIELMNTWPPQSVGVDYSVRGSDRQHIDHIKQMERSRFGWEKQSANDGVYWQYDTAKLMTTIVLPKSSAAKVRVNFMFPHDPNLLGKGYPRCWNRLITCKQLLNNDSLPPKIYMTDYYNIESASEVPTMINGDLHNAQTLLQQFGNTYMPAALKDVNKLNPIHEILIHQLKPLLQTC